MRALLILLLAGAIYAKSVVIEVPKMSCSFCVTTIKNAITKLDGVENVKVTLNTKEATLDFDESKVSVKEIMDAINTTTYEPFLKSLK